MMGSKIPWIGVGTVGVIAIAVASAHAQLGPGWVPTTFTKRIHLDDENGLETFSWTSYKAVGSNTPCADYTYDSTDDSETFRIFDSRSNRSEIRLQNEYVAGRGQFEGYVTFYPPLENESLMQIFGSTTGATLMMTRGYSASGGSITVTSTGGGVTYGNRTIVTACYGVEVRINIIHDQDNYVRWYVNGVLKCEQRDTEVGVTNYWKYGCYGTTSGNVPAIVKWRRVRTFKNGYPPGANVVLAPGALTVSPAGGATSRVDVTGFSGTVTLSASNVPAGATATFTPPTVAGGAGSSILAMTTSAGLATGVYPVAILASDNTANSAATLNFGVIPVGWLDQDVGGPGRDGGAGYSGGVFTVSGGGDDIWGAADKFNFVYQAYAGNLIITARVDNQQNTDPWAKAGVMVRESTNADSAYAAVFVTPTATHGVSLQYRPATGSNAVDLAEINGPAAPYWVRLVRSGSIFAGYHSPDGVNWTQTGVASVPMIGDVLIGLAVTAHNDLDLNTAYFSNVSLPPNFVLAATPAAQSVLTGQSTNFQITLTSLNGFAGSVGLGVTGLPPNASATFNPPSLSGNGSSSLTLATSNTTPAGNFAISITGIAGNITRTSTISLFVNTPPTDLVWASTSSTVWDTNTPNWFDGEAGTNAVFEQSQNVVFADRAGVVTDVTIPADLAVMPGTMTVDAETNNFTFSGAGRISGAAGLVKKGGSTLTLSTANDFTGTVTIRGGILKAGDPGALGATSGGTVITNSGTLDVGGWNLAGEPITASGSGAGGTGAIVNSGAVQTSALRNVILAGDTVFGGDNRWDIRAASTGSTNGCWLSTLGRPCKLTKVGSNEVSLVAVSVDPALGNVDIVEGTLGIQTATSQFGNPSATLTVFSNATLNVYRLTNTPLYKIIVLKNGSTIHSENDRNVIRGPIELESGNATFNVSNSGGGPPALVLSNVVSGEGGLTKIGLAPLVLAAPGSYTGGTLVSEGSLALIGPATISDSVRISIAAGASLDVSGRSNRRLTLDGDQTLAGNGTLKGSLTVGLGAAVTPGESIGALTVTNAVTLRGTTVMELDEGNGTNDVIRGAAIDFGGTLMLANLSGTLTNGDSFKLFDAAGYSGAFAGLVPAIPAINLGWDTNTLATDGTLRVVAVPTPRPRIDGYGLSGAALVISGTNGVPAWTYYVLASTNVSLPVEAWARVMTNQFDDNGTFSFTNAVNPDLPQQFFRLQVP